MKNLIIKFTPNSIYFAAERRHDESNDTLKYQFEMHFYGTIEDEVSVRFRFLPIKL